MPLHPTIASRIPLLEGIPSISEALCNPQMMSRLQEFDSYPDAEPPIQVPTEEMTVSGPHGRVPIRVYRPAPGRPVSGTGLVWMHGGAFQFGDLDMKEADWTAREMVKRAGAVVVSVDYRLAKDGVRYPVPLDDVVAVVGWVRNNLEGLGIDRVALGGASAGGHLAASAALRLRDEDCWAPECLILVYPSAHFYMPEPSRSLKDVQAELPPVMTISHDFHRKTITNYLGGDGFPTSPYAMPGEADPTGLGPTLVINAEYDDLRASGEAFSAALAAAGVDIQQVLARGLLHGFLNLPADLEPVSAVLELMAQRLRRQGS